MSTEQASSFHEYNFKGSKNSQHLTKETIQVKVIKCDLAKWAKNYFIQHENQQLHISMKKSF